MSNSIHVTRGFGVWLAVAALGLGGCYAHATAEPVLVEAEYTPVTVDVYPHAVYEGRTVYLIHDHWYTRDRGRWVYYQSEPAPLYRHRQSLVVHQAPPAPARARVVRGRHVEHGHHDHNGDRARERHNVHEAQPAIPRD